MTVGELIEALTYNPDIRVIIKGSGELIYPIESKFIYGYDGESIVLCADSYRSIDPNADE